MEVSNESKAEAHEFAEVEPPAEPAAQTHSLRDLASVRLSITADLGKSSMLVREVLDLKKGSVVSLDKLAGEMTDVYVNGMPLAKGEVVVIGDALHVRIAEIWGVNESDIAEEGDG